LLVTIIGLHLLVIDVAIFSPLALGMVSVAGLPGKEVHKSVQLQPGIEDGKVTVIRASGERAARRNHIGMGTVTTVTVAMVLCRDSLGAGRASTPTGDRETSRNLRL
jgi:hypothetical protein